MRKKLLWTLMLVACGCTAALAQTPQPGAARPAPQAAAPAAGGAVPTAKIAVVFFATFRNEIGQLKQRYDKLTAEFDPRARDLESMQTSIAAKEKVLQENKNLTQPQYRKLTDEYEGLKKEFERKREDSQALARKREEEEAGPVLEQIQKSLAAYSQQRGITLVLEGAAAQQAGLLVYAAPGMDITQDFVKEYNKANPGPAAAAPKPASPAPATPRPATPKP